MMFVRRSIRLVMVPIAGAALAALPACEDGRENLHPVCEVRPPTILMAESVRTASRVPCIRSLPLGWEWGSFHAEAGGSAFVLGSTSGGDSALTVRLVPRCSVDATATRSDPEGVVMRERVISREPYLADRTYSFEGGCALVRVAFASGAPVDELLRDIDRSIGFLERSAIDAELRSQTDRRLDPADV